MDSPSARILEIRGQRVILDRDLATLFDVPTKQLNQAVRRNRAKFPDDFAFPLTRQELRALRSQIVTSKVGRGGTTWVPWAFTEHGVIMAASVLNSPKAIEMSVFVVRAFVDLRRQFLMRDELARRLDVIERKLMRHDAALQQVHRDLAALRELGTDTPKSRIGFNAQKPE